MSKSFGDGWTTKEVSTDTLQLDAKNPRLNLKDGASQEQIRKALLASEDVFELAQKIANTGKMLAGERLIVVKEAGKYVVLEGNRRATAAQTLRKPALLTKEQQKRLPKIGADLKRRLGKLPVDIAPDRLSAEPILTKRHTERGVKPWSTLANMRRVARYFERGHSVDEISQALSLSRGRITQLLRGHKLLLIAQQAPGWSAEEQKQLSDPKLITSGFTRFFTLKDARIKLDVDFNSKMEPTSGKLKSQLAAEIQKIAKGYLIKDQAGKTLFDTRSTPEDVLAGRARSKAAINEGGAAAIRTPTASKFFEKIECKINDDTLIKLCDELRSVNPKQMPIAATVLLRSTLELALAYQVKKKGKWKELVAENKGRDPTLAQILGYCAKSSNAIFTETRVSTILNNQNAREAKDYLDQVTHGRWVDADAERLYSIANSFRKVISEILGDTQ